MCWNRTVCPVVLPSVIVIAGLIPQSLQLRAQLTLASQADVTSLESARIGVRVGQCVSAVRAVEVSVLVCLRSGCSHATELGGPRFCGARAEGCHSTWWGLCGSNPAIHIECYEGTLMLLVRLRF